MADEERDLNLIEYRLDVLETTVAGSLVEINEKLDSVLVALQASTTVLALEGEKRIQLEKRIGVVESRIDNTIPAATCTAYKENLVKDIDLMRGRQDGIRTDVDSLKVSTAERFGPGAIAGAVVAGLFLIMKLLIGV